MVATKKIIKKNKPTANTNKVFEKPSKTPEGEVSVVPKELDVNEFEEFYHKALKEYMNFKENAESAAKEAEQSFVAKFSKRSLRIIYSFSITVFMIYLLKLYIVYQMKNHLSVLNMAPKAVSTSIDQVRFFILSSFQCVLSFLQNTFGIFSQLKLKNEKKMLVDHLVMGLKSDHPHRTNVDSVLLYINLVIAIIRDQIKLLLPDSVNKYISIVDKSIREHLAIFHQRVFVEVASLLQIHHVTTYDLIVKYFDLFMLRLHCILNCSLEKLKQIVL